MFPYRDENETIRTPIVTIALIVTNALAWFLVQGAGLGDARVEEDARIVQAMAGVLHARGLNVAPTGMSCQYMP